LIYAYEMGDILVYVRFQFALQNSLNKSVFSAIRVS
jgi:hypothetical protein